MREVIRQNKNGTVLKYYEEVESYRIKGKIKQRHILVMDSLRLNNWKEIKVRLPVSPLMCSLYYESHVVYMHTTIIYYRFVLNGREIQYLRICECTHT